MFLGKHEHLLDVKNRLALPSNWRKLLQDKVIISISSDGCIELRTVEAYEQYTNTLMSLNSNKESVRRIHRIIFSNSIDVTIDKANRILLPMTLINLAKIKKSVMMLGMQDKIEIWDLDTYMSKPEFNDLDDMKFTLESLCSND